MLCDCNIELTSHMFPLFPLLIYVDLEWKIIYVGSASSEAHDQTLDSVLVGPVPIGKHRFVFQVNCASYVTGFWDVPCVILYKKW